MIIPYYGSWPSYFYEWGLSASKNTFIDFKIITDLEPPTFSFTHTNIEFISMKLSAIRARADVLLGFRTCLVRPYKLCDFKPLYGLLFPEIVEGYEWWGYGDIDAIYGNLRDFWPKPLPDSVQYLWGLGHFSFFRNDNIVNRMPLTVGKKELRRVLSTRVSYGFDEGSNGLPALLKRSGVMGAGDLSDIHDMICGVPFLKPALHFNGFYHHLYGWENGFLTCYSTDINGTTVVKENCFYMHLQKRIIEEAVNHASANSGFTIFPDRIVEKILVTSKLILEHSRRIPEKKSPWIVRSASYLFPRLKRRAILCFDRIAYGHRISKANIN